MFQGFNSDLLSFCADIRFMIFEENGHLAIDCGCIYGLKLAAYCLDTQEAFYVDSLQPPKRKKERE